MNIKTILFIILFSPFCLAQQEVDSVSVLRNKLENFKYQQVIDIAQQMLRNKNNLEAGRQIEIYKLMGISQFSLLQDEAAKKSFMQILTLDSAFAFDSVKTSPKIVSFFNQVREEYSRENSIKKKSVKAKADTVIVTKQVPSLSAASNLKHSVILSAIFPGLGQFYRHENSKGWILTTLGAAALSSAVYFIIDSNNKEKKYLNAVDKTVIQSMYNNYNSSYMMKNISLISFAAVWLYSQIDILFFSELKLPENSQLNIDSSNNMRLTINFPF